MRRLVCLLAIALLAVAPSGTGPRAKIVFGAAMSFSGPLANEGRLTREGYDVWTQYVNAHGGLRVGRTAYDVEIRYADDGSDAQTAARIIERMIREQHVDFILGPYSSAPTFAAAAVTERERVPMVEGAGAADRIFDQGYRYTFGVLSPARKYLVGIIEFAVHRNPRPRTVAITAASDAFSLEVQQGAVDSANNHGIKVVYADHYGDDPASVQTTVAAVKAAAPDIVLNAGHLQDALQLHRALRDQRVSAKIYGYSVGPDTPAFRTALGADADAVLGSAQWSEAVTYTGAPGFYPDAKAYAAAFRRQYGRAPDYHNAEASAACLAFQYALERAGTTDREAVRDALARLDVVTFFGLLKFDRRGINVYKPMVVNQIQRGKLVTIYPYRLADAQPIYPAPAWREEPSITKR